jgi:hypothetical protein
MEEKLSEILTSVQNNELSIIDAQVQILDLFEVSKSSILKGGDGLSEYGEGHREDCEIIKKVLISKGFINAGLNDSVWLWADYSESYAAGWLGLPDKDEEIYQCIKDYIKTTHYCG